MIVIEIPDAQAAALKARAAAQGLTQAWLGKLAEESAAALPRRPLKTGRGMLAKYGPAPTAEEIDRIGATCSAVSLKISDDRRCRGYAYCPLLSLQ